jgi:hypothetical protein
VRRCRQAAATFLGAVASAELCFLDALGGVRWVPVE